MSLSKFGTGFIVLFHWRMLLERFVNAHYTAASEQVTTERPA